MATQKPEKVNPPVTEVMSEREIAKSLGGEIVTTVPARFSDEILGTIDSFDAAMGLAEDTFGGVTFAHEEPLLGNGFRVASHDDKLHLVGVPLLLLDWTFNESDFGQERDWVMIHAVQRGGAGEAIKWILSDGGTGIAKDLKTFTEKTGRDGGLLVKKGLLYSKYFIDSETGKALSKKEVRQYMIDSPKKLAEAGTWYLDFAA